MSALPGIPLALLEAVLPRPLADPLIGDLIEEFAMREALSSRAARCWLVGQVARSLPHAVRAAIRAIPWPVLAASALAATATATAILTASSALWRHVLFQVPFRAGHAPPVEWQVACALFAAGSALLAALIGAHVGRLFSVRRSR